MAEVSNVLLFVIVILGVVTTVLALVQLIVGIGLLTIIHVGILRFAGMFGMSISLLCMGIMGMVTHYAIILIVNRKYTKWQQCCEHIVLSLIPVCVICNLVCAIVMLTTVVTNQNGEKEIQENVMLGLHQYASNMETKLEMDHLQEMLHCCGAHGYKDYFEVNWYAPEENTSNDSSSSCIAQESVPFSCCDPYVLKPCMQNDLKYNGEDTLYQKGCAKSLAEQRLVIGFAVAALYSITGIMQGFLAWHIFQITDFTTKQCLLFSKRGSSEIASFGGDTKARDLNRNKRKRPHTGWLQGKPIDGGDDEISLEDGWAPSEFCNESSSAYVLPSCHEQHVISQETH